MFDDLHHSPTIALRYPLDPSSSFYMHHPSTIHKVNSINTYAHSQSPTCLLYNNENVNMQHIKLYFHRPFFSTH